MSSIPDLGLGTAPLGGLYELIPESQAVATIHHAFQRGIRFFDTAPHYGAGLAEHRLGLALRDIPRDEITISTKVGKVIVGDRTVPNFTQDGIMRSLTSSLDRLGVDRVDILHIHDPDAHMDEAINLAYPVLADLKTQGVIDAIGVGTNSWQKLLEFVRAVPLDCALLAGRYTLLEHTTPEQELLPLCAEQGVKIIAGGVFNSGILATGNVAGAPYNYFDAPEAVRTRVDQLQRLCDQHAIPLPAAALQFPRRHPAVPSMVVGARSPQEIDAMIDNLTVEIPEAFWATLRETDRADST